MSTTSNPRPVYAPSGRFEPAGLAVRLLVLAGVAALFAVGLAWLVRLDGYAVGYVWIFPVAMLIGLVQKTVADSNCRNQVVGACVGLFAGLLTQLGMYHVDQCGRWGVGWERLDWLPGYVTFRMETDGWWWPDGRMPTVWALPANPQVDPHLPPRVGQNWHWLAFLAEFGALVFLPTQAGWSRAGRPFGERTNRWLTRELLVLTCESADGLRQALRDGSVAEWAASAPMKAITSDSHTKVYVWYCLRDTAADDPESDVYLSFGTGSPLRLSPEEAAALVTVVPGLVNLAAPLSEEYAAPGAAAGDPTAARLSRIDGPHVGRAKDRGVIWFGRLVGWAVVCAPVLFAAALCGSAYLVYEACVLFGLPEALIAGFLVTAAIICLYALRAWNNPESDATWRWLVWYYRRVVAREVAAREDPLFPPDHPGAVYCEMLPRRAWSDLEGHRDECEGGFLLADAERGLLFEGDRYRFVIPAATVERCELEEVVSRAGQPGTTAGFFAVVLVVRTADGARELPLCPFAGVEGRNRWEQANALHERLTRLLAGAPSDVPLTVAPTSPGA